jgi:hypothetical protein
VRSHQTKEGRRGGIDKLTGDRVGRVDRDGRSEAHESDEPEFPRKLREA